MYLTSTIVVYLFSILDLKRHCSSFFGSNSSWNNMVSFFHHPVGNMVILIGIDVNKAFYKTGNEIVRSQIKSSGDWLNIDNEYHNDLSIMMVVDSFFILQYLFGHDRRAHSIQITADREFL